MLCYIEPPCLSQGIDKAVETYTTTKSYFNSATDKLKQATPEPNQALEALRSQAYHYAAFVPGGRGYVDTAFKDIDAIREKHGEVSLGLRRRSRFMRRYEADHNLDIVSCRK
jgi:uncharacterized protein (DUF2252 family)